MLKSLLIYFIILFFCLSAFSQNNDYILIVEEDYQGVILSLKTEIPFQSYTRTQLSINTVKYWEDWLDENRKVLISEEHHQKSYCPDVSKDLHKFYRQYYAYSYKGEDYLIINAFWKEDIDVFPNWIHEYVKALDGCTYYWRALINIDKQEFIRTEFNSEN